jgi:long-subunit acyl-CoA synthetase (AMP-forming)
MGEMAAIMAGGVSAGIYPTDTKEQVAYKVLHSNAHIALVEDNKKAKTILASIDELPALKTIVVWGETPESEVATRSDSSQVRILTWDGLLKLGDESKNDDELQARMDGQEPGGCCALIYTSGTTGQPKAVMISHDNILFEVRSLFKNLVPPA